MAQLIFPSANQNPPFISENRRPTIVNCALLEQPTIPRAKWGTRTFAYECVSNVVDVDSWDSFDCLVCRVCVILISFKRTLIRSQRPVAISESNYASNCLLIDTLFADNKRRTKFTRTILHSKDAVWSGTLNIFRYSNDGEQNASHFVARSRCQPSTVNFALGCLFMACTPFQRYYTIPLTKQRSAQKTHFLLKLTVKRTALHLNW